MRDKIFPPVEKKREIKEINDNPLSGKVTEILEMYLPRG